MDCLKCGAEAKPGKALCESCFAKPREVPKITRTVRQQVDHGRRNLIAIIAVSLAGLIFLVYSINGDMTPIPFKSTFLSTLDGGSAELCEGKKGCLLVFVAPWCSSCHGSVGLINELAAAARNTDLRLEVVVGSSDVESLRNFGREFQTRVFIDNNNLFSRKVDIPAVPRYFAVNSEQEIYRSFFVSSFRGQNKLELLRDVLHNYAPELTSFLNLNS